MVDSDEDYSTDTIPEETLPLGNDQLDNEKNMAEKETRKSARKAAISCNKSKPALPDNLRALVLMKNHLTKCLKGQDIDSNVSLRVCKAALEMQERYLRAKQKLSSRKDAQPKRPAIKATITSFFGIGNDQYTKILNEYLTNRQPYITGKAGHGRSGNQCAKPTRIVHGLEVTLNVQRFIRERRMRRERVTGRQVLDHLVQEGLLVVPVDDFGIYEKKPFQSAYRTVRRFLEKLGYERGRRTGNLVEKESVVLHRQNYLKKFFENREKEPGNRFREVYLDESYIHQHYHQFDDSLWDPNDEQDVQVSRFPAKGRRYCFAAAIQGPDPSVCVTEASEKQVLAGLVPGTLWSFCPQGPRASSGDYHKVFNGENFLKWWKDQLIPNLHQPSIIMLDNAKYHLVYDETVPKTSKMKKQELIGYLESKGVTLEGQHSVVQLRSMARQWIKEHEKIAIVKIAEEAGHTVLLTPPYHSDLQPIELVWAYIKGNIGRKYNSETTLEVVHNHLIEEFARLEHNGHASVGKMIEKCARKGAEMYQEQLVADEPDEYGSEESDNDAIDSEQEDVED